MPTCVVKYCSRNTKQDKKAQGITFHRFPKEPVWRENWIRIIRECRGQTDWNPTKTSVVCSEHFQESDMYNTKEGLRRIVSFGVPQKCLYKYPDKQGMEYPAVLERPFEAVKLTDALDVPVTPVVIYAPSTSFTRACAIELKNEVEATETADSIQSFCRFCLNFDCKLKPINLYGLRGLYELITGTPLINDDGLPQVLCVECATHLVKFRKFRDKCLEAFVVLHDINLNNGTSGFVEEMIKSARENIVNRHPNLSFSNLVVDLDISPKPYVVINPYTDEKLNKESTETNEDNCSDIKIDRVQKFDEKIEMLSDSSAYEEEWLELDMIDQNSSVKAVVEEIIHHNNDISKSIDCEKTADKTLSQIKKEKVTKCLVSNISIKANKRKCSANNKLIKTNKRKENADNRFISNNNDRDEFINKLIELVELDDLDENEHLESMKRKRIKFGKNPGKMFKIKKERDAFLKECFVKKTLLSLNEQQSSFEKLKLSQSYVKANFKCELCYKGYINEQFLKTHNNKYHSTARGEHLCKVCKMRCRTEWGLLIHIKSHHVYEYQCKTCDETFCYYLPAESHAKKHKGIRYVCQHCGDEFERSNAYLSHLRFKHPSSDHVCVFCGYSFVNEHGLNFHVKFAHKERAEFADLPCSSCNLKFASKDALKTHVGINHPVGKPKYNDPVKRKLTKEERKKYPKKPLVKFPLPCEACGVDINSFQHYRRHFFEAHPNMERKFVLSKFYSHMCDICGLKFHAKSVLEDHLLIHGSESNVKCPKCDKTFKSQGQLRSHVINHLKPEHCHICGKSITKGNLRKHVMVKHNDIRKFECEICGKKFKTRGEVRYHTKYVHMNVPWPKKRNTTDGPPVRKKRKLEESTRQGEMEDNNGET